MLRRNSSIDKVTTGKRTYTYRVKASKDGTKYLIIDEVHPASPRRAYRPALMIEASLHTFRARFQKAARFVSRRV